VVIVFWGTKEKKNRHPSILKKKKKMEKSESGLVGKDSLHEAVEIVEV